VGNSLGIEKLILPQRPLVIKDSELPCWLRSRPFPPWVLNPWVSVGRSEALPNSPDSCLGPWDPEFSQGRVKGGCL
jgi:hypothetical protein